MTITGLSRYEKFMYALCTKILIFRINHNI